jgi:hypothetical protein
MDRREAITRVGLLLGGTVIGAEFFLSGCQPASRIDTDDLFDEETIAFLNEVGETILPKTSTPGAKAANVGSFMALMVRDCYKKEDQETFKKGLKELDEASIKKNGKRFTEADATQRTDLLVQLDKEQKDYNKTKKEEAPNHYFTMLKQLTLLGYFTSEIGCTQALRYVPVPGKYVGDYPYMKGDKAWALA